MGDHRMSIKIQAEFHGVKEETDMWINYSTNGCCGIDNRIIEFFQDLHQKGMKVYDKNLLEYFRQDKEREEKEELKRLLKKYPNPK